MPDSTSNSRYFLSTYMSSPQPELVFSGRHDHSVALWEVAGGGVRLARIWEFERLSGQKHHNWPLFTADRAVRFVQGLLAGEGLDWLDIECTWGTPGLPGYAELKLPDGSDQFPVHSLAHLYSGLLMDSRLFASSDIVALAIDGGPDFVLDDKTKDYWYAGAVSKKGQVFHAPVESPATLYGACRTLFKTEEGTLMALASACTARIKFDTMFETGKIELYGGRNLPSATAMPFVRQIEQAAREQLSPESMDHRFSAEENIQSAVMKVVQAASEEIVARNIERLCEVAGVKPAFAYLSLTGGFALNCPANSRMVDHFGFRGLLTPPCPNDAGQALGLGLLGLRSMGLLSSAEFVFDTPFLGREADDAAGALTTFAPWIKDDSAFDSQRFVEDIIAGPVAWVSGAAEVGPRALGHRSLLADPRSTAAKDALNKVKGRQWWRPVAPIVLREHAADWFDMDRESPYMLETATIRVDKLDRIPAVAHLDGSARLQTLSHETDSDLYEAIDAFRAVTGVPILCNTSLNDKGEPIVNTVAEALNFCVRKGIAVAYVSGRRIAVGYGSAADLPAGPQPRDTAAFAGQEQDRDRVWQARLAEGMTPEALFLRSRSPELRGDGVTARDLVVAARMTAGRYEGFARAVARFKKHFGPGSGFAAVPFSPDLDE